MVQTSTTDKIFVAAYGARYESFLSACLESIHESMPSALVEAWIGNMDAHSQSILESAFPNVTFRTSEPVDETIGYTALVSGKLEQWSAWFARTSNGDRCFLLDADTLVRSDLFEHFPQTCNLLFTYKPEKWPLNVGVVGAISSPVSRKFFLEWLFRTRAILASSQGTDEAVATAGAVDQFAFLELLGVTKDLDTLALGPGPYSIEISGETVFAQGIECRILNQTNSVPHDDPAVVLHYKANMRDVIEHDGRFNSARPAESSRDMVGVWESTYRRFCERTLPSYVASGKEALDSLSLDSVRGGFIEPRGVLNSEGACFAGLCRLLGVQNVVESGRARAQSTFLLATLLPDVKIFSIESECDADAQFGVSRLQEFANVTLIEGDAWVLASHVLGDLKEPTALLIDGPKGEEAVRLAQQLVAVHEHVVLIGIHDMHRNDTTARGLPNISRHWFSHAFDRHIFTDNEHLVDAFSELDAGGGITPHRKSPWDLGSYGPTLGLAIVTWRDRFRVLERESESIRKSVWAPVVSLFLPNIYRKLPKSVQGGLRVIRGQVR